MATVNDLLIRVRRKLGDMQKLKLSDVELMDAMNDAIDSLSGKLSIDTEPEMTKTVTITGTTPIARPNDFIRFMGQYPVCFTTDENGAVSLKHLDTAFDGTMEIRYYATKDKIDSLSDTIPFSRLIHQTMLVDLTVAAFAEVAEGAKAHQGEEPKER